MSGDVNTVLDEWNTIEEQIEKLKSKLSKCKRVINTLMENGSVNTFTTEDYKVVKKIIKSSRINKGDIPLELWTKYSKNSESTTFVLKKL